MTRFSKQQRRVLRSEARVTLVQATAGSGKTFVFAHRFLHFIRRWDRPNQGVAALSFTNVAQREILARIGGNPGDPHFIGTLDSFMLRFVVRPFAAALGLPSTGPRLVPAPLHLEYSEPSVQVGITPAQSASLFHIRFLDEAPLRMEAERLNRRADAIPPSRIQDVLRSKWDHWRSTGLITHSDTHYLAYAILRDAQLGPRAANILAARFPVILVDELQDTGWFLGRALLQLLEHASITGFLVGDPDQAIYEFSGASPRLFDEIEALPGCKTLHLDQSRRCSRSVSRVASSLSESGNRVRTIRGAPRGAARLVVHRQPRPDAAGLLDDFAGLIAPGESAALLTRNTATMRRLCRQTSGSAEGALSGGSRTIQRATELFLAGDKRSAAGALARLLSHLVLDDAQPTFDALAGRGIHPGAWRLFIFRLLSASVRSVGVTWRQWGDQMKEVLDREARALGCPVSAQTLGHTVRIRSTIQQEVRQLPPTDIASGQSASMFSIRNVHQVKGQEFGCVGYYIQRPHQSQAPCPSTVWWQPSSEERRVAFVAASRARRLFALYVHQETYRELQQLRSDFLRHFSVHKI